MVEPLRLLQFKGEVAVEPMAEDAFDGGRLAALAREALNSGDGAKDDATREHCEGKAVAPEEGILRLEQGQQVGGDESGMRVSNRLNPYMISVA
jgi:hypothetical protein